MKKKYKAIISDIDGTLIDSSNTFALPTDIVKKSIQNVIKKDIIFSLASARPHRMLTYLIENLSLQSPIIINNGAEIYDTRNNIPLWESTIPTDIAKEIFTMIKKQRKYHIDLSRQELINPTSFPENEKIFKFVIFDLKQDEANKLIKDVQTKFKTVNCGKGGSYIGSELFAVFISNGGATKQHAIVKFAEILSLDTSEIIAIGDHYNDFPLLMACGLKVAMGNAVPELKEIADYIAPSVEEDGVADVIEKFIL
jgi:hypothetical protein